MTRLVRSTFTSAAAVLCVLATGSAAHPAPRPAVSAETVDSPAAAPDCVHLAVDWRYTFVTSDCATPLSVTVQYLDGTEVPCRWVAPGDLITFPGTGTTGNEVLGAVLCPTGA